MSDKNFDEINRILTTTDNTKLSNEIIQLLSEWAEMKVQNDLLRQELETLEEMLEDLNESDYITFPNDFFHYDSKEARAMTDKEVTKLINELIAESEWEKGMFAQSGDTLVCKFKNEEEEMIFVAKDYFELNIVED